MSTAYALSPVEIFRAVLAEEGMRGALKFLNGRTSHRFTSIYRFDGSVLCNLYLYDRANPGLQLFPDAALEESYCSVVNETRAAFVTLDSLHDERVRNHPKRELVLSYCGIPLVREDGTLFGTLCHFDFVPHTIPPYLLRELEPDKVRNQTAL